MAAAVVLVVVMVLLVLAAAAAAADVGDVDYQLPTELFRISSCLPLKSIIFASREGKNVSTNDVTESRGA